MRESGVQRLGGAFRRTVSASILGVAALAAASGTILLALRCAPGIDDGYGAPVASRLVLVLAPAVAGALAYGLVLRSRGVREIDELRRAIGGRPGAGRIG
jgi:hypothetical protein